MMILRKFFHLSWTDRWLLIEGAANLCFLRLILTLVPFKHLVPSLEKPISVPDIELNQDTEKLVKKVRWAVRVISQRIPWKPSCLENGIAAKRILQHRHIPSTLFLGVAKNNQNLLEAHAWLQCGTFIVTGEFDHQRYLKILSFSDKYA